MMIINKTANFNKRYKSKYKKVGVLPIRIWTLLTLRALATEKKNS